MRKLLFVSNLFPDSEQPIRGLDNATLLHSMRDEWEVRVLSPRPVLSPWQRVELQARVEDQALSPQYVSCPYIPKVGSRANDKLMARALRPAFDKLVSEFKPEAVLCSWLYPDGCAVARLAMRHHLPLILITQGSDTHGYLKIPVRRKKIISAIRESSAVICRSGNLADRLQGAGADQDKLKVIYNGVDTEIFQHRNRDSVRRELQLAAEQPILLFVGNYLPVKNPLFLIQAHAELNRRRSNIGSPPTKLILVGDGPMRPAMESAIAGTDCAGSFDLRSRETPDSVARLMNASDLLCLSSHNEGFPNVILEAMACNLKVVSTDVGGIAELVNHPGRGLLVPTADLSGYVDALETALKGTNGSQTVEEVAGDTDWSWKGAARRYGNVIESAITAG
ncbi:MAG: glycosyltransferase [Luteolibacter sp.]